MKRFPLFILTSLLATGIILFSCTKEEDDSFNETAYTGWAVGGVDQGYATLTQTANSGMEWSRQGSVSQMGGISLYDVSASSAKQVWAVGDIADGFGSVWYSSDGGYNWSRRGDTAVFGSTVLQAVWAKGGQRTWVAGHEGLIAYSDNAGTTWSTVTIDTLPLARYTAIGGDSTRILWVVGNNYDTTGTEGAPVLLHSADGGVTFTRQSPGPGYSGHLYDISVVNDSTAWIASSNHLLVTSDRGTTWQIVYTAPSGNIHSVCALRNGTVWAGGENGVVYRRHAGSWVAMNPNGNRYTLTGITLADTNRIWITGGRADLSPSGSIFYSQNNGTTWFIEDPRSSAPMHRITLAGGRR